MFNSTSLVSFFENNFAHNLEINNVFKDINFRGIYHQFSKQCILKSHVYAKIHVEHMNTVYSIIISIAASEFLKALNYFSNYLNSQT